MSWFDAAKFGWRKSYETMGAAVEQVKRISRRWFFTLYISYFVIYTWCPSGKLPVGGQDQSHRGAARLGGRLVLQISQVEVVMDLLLPLRTLLIFFRFLFQLNVVLGLVRCLPTFIKFRIMYFMCTLHLSRSFCFLSVPQILDRFYEDGNRTNTENAYPGNFSFGDIFTGGVSI